VAPETPAPWPMSMKRVMAEGGTLTEAP
jgi:hypothetical protein